MRRISMLVATLSTLSGLAQNDIEWGKANSTPVPVPIMHSDENHIWTEPRGGKRASFKQFDRDFTLHAEAEFPKSEGRTSTLLKTSMSGKLVTVKVSIDKKAGKQKVIATFVDSKSMGDAASKTLATSDLHLPYEKPQVVTSENGEFLAVLFGAKDGANFQHVFLFDNSFQEQWSSIVDISEVVDKPELLGSTIGDDGCVYLEVGTENSARGIQHLLKVHEDIATEVELDLHQQENHSWKVSVLEDGKGYVLGMVKHKWGSREVFYRSFDGQGKLNQSSNIDLGSEFVTKYWDDTKAKKSLSDEQKGKSKAFLGPIAVCDVIVDDNSGVTLIAEEIHGGTYETPSTSRMVTSRSTVGASGMGNPNNFSQTQSLYENGDIIAVKFDEQGQLTWKTKLHKSHKVQNSNKHSVGFVGTHHQNQYTFLFNDHKLNYSASGNYKGESEAKALGDNRSVYILAQATLDMTTGSISRIRLSDYDGVKGVLAPEFSSANHVLNQVVLMTFNDGKRQVGLLKL